MKTLLILATSIISAFLLTPIYSVPPEWFEELERQWIDEGHLPELTEDEIQYRRTERRKLEAVSKLNEYMRSSSASQAKIDGMLRKVDEIGRPIIFTATLTEAYRKANKYDDQDDLTWDQEADKCDEWLERIYFRVKEVSCFPATGSILVSVKRDYEAEDVWAFLEKQTEIEQLEWKDRIVHPYKMHEDL